MSTLPGPFYRFATQDQWDRATVAGLSGTARIDVAAAIDAGGVSGCRIGPHILSPEGDLFWVADSRLFAAGREAPYVGVEGPMIGVAARLAADRHSLWALSICGEPEHGHRRLIQVDSESLQLVADMDAEGVADIAPDGGGGLWLLAGDTIRRIAASGAQEDALDAPDCAASALAAAGSRLALLSADGRRLFLIDPKAPGAAMSIKLSLYAGPGWDGETASLSSAGGNFLLQGEVETRAWGERTGKPRFFLIDPGGGLILDGEWSDDGAAMPLAAFGGDLLGLSGGASGRRILRFGGMALGGGERRLTPALDTESPVGRWLRAEVEALLPERSTLTLRWAASADPGLRLRIERILADATVPKAWRLERVDDLLSGSWSEFTYVGESRVGPAVAERLAFPLHEANGPVLWVDLALRRNSADAEPRIDSLLVLHEAESLIDHLPAVYRGDGDRDGTMRRLVAVLETTTQGVDLRIGRLASRLDPRRTSARWLPELAAMLGLPFDDALSPEMQRRLVEAAPAILARRGTRLGLVHMLEALFPGRPIRVIDRTEQLIPITLGRGLGGRGLPALLSGPSARVPRLNARLVLKKTALCRTDACAELSIAPPPQVLIAIPGSRSERRYGHAIAAMAEAMIPAGVRLRLTWTPRRGGSGPAPDDVLTIIEPPELIGLGDGPGLGRARIGGRAVARLDQHGVDPAANRLW
jgi:phage tail-like protein